MVVIGVIMLGNFFLKVFCNKIVFLMVVIKKYYGKVIMFYLINGEKFYECYYSCLIIIKWGGGG